MQVMQASQAEPIISEKQACKARIYELVHPAHPNDWEIDSIVEEIIELPVASRDLLLAQVPVIWPISHSLCLSFLEDGARSIHTIPADLVPAWVRAILRRYESTGLSGARRLISHARERFLEPRRSGRVVTFDEVARRMLFYLRGISQEQFELGIDQIPHTDTTTFYLPPSVSLLDRDAKNQLLYKFLLTLHWGFYRLGTFRRQPPSVEQAFAEQQKIENDPEARLPIVSFLERFPSKELATDLFFLLETRRVMNWLAEELPGLVREFNYLQKELVQALGEPSPDQVAARVTGLGWWALFGEAARPEWLTELDFVKDLERLLADDPTASLHLLYQEIDAPLEVYRRPSLLTFLGRHDFLRVEAEIGRKRVLAKEAFVLQLQALERNSAAASEIQDRGGGGEKADQTMLVAAEGDDSANTSRLRALLENPETELPEELVELIQMIGEDLGRIPDSYFAAASGLAGEGFNRGDERPGTGEEAVAAGTALDYDEWDYRRNGYRQNWCRVHERELVLLQSSFADTTLEKYRGLLIKLRRQFEMMKITEHFSRRQREGDDLDLDAIVEARGDKRAGISPSSKLFVRLQRNERDIATIFLVDMSNSTEGWVGTVIKEALLLLCEVMDVAGDPYGILGFSGMRRSRCDVYRIKDIEEPYNRLIRQRINSIQPREYTRMGPAVRHAFELLKGFEARTRLLVTITDGKPEDYDDYKGEYAIEDTRKALLEVRGAGIHTFCITVDRESHEYLPRMFGTGNYIFIDDIDKLPLRMIDLYRLLTS